MQQSSKKARISGFRLWIIPELSILPLKIAGSGYEIEMESVLISFDLDNGFCLPGQLFKNKQYHTSFN